MRSFIIVAFLALAAPLYSQPDTFNPIVCRIVEGVSEQRITATLKKLESFGTRNIQSSQTDPDHGVGAAMRWIVAELKSYSPRLEVSLDTHRVKKQGRISADTEISNIIAVLPGTVSKDREVMISAHYDTLALAAPLTEAQRRAGEQIKMADPNAPAPGVNDDGSGTAAVMELARVMSQHEFEKTVVFMLFTAEEQGLVGATLFAAEARAQNRPIEAVFNNDIIGSDVSGDGLADGASVRVFSEDPNDSPSRELARYLKTVGERYVPSMKVDLVFRSDRMARGGDQTPMNQEGFTAVRISSAEENYSNQHTPTDILANMSPAYTTRVAKINAAAAATLALAPRMPVTEEPIPSGPRKGKLQPMIGRGKSRYDAQLRWTAATEPDLAGYIVLMRSTTDALWQRSFFVKKDARELLLPGVSVDEYVFGVAAVDADGNASLPSVYIAPPRAKLKVETY